MVSKAIVDMVLKKEKKEEIVGNQMRITRAVGAYTTNSAVSENMMKRSLTRLINSL